MVPILRALEKSFVNSRCECSLRAAAAVTAAAATAAAAATELPPCSCSVVKNERAFVIEMFTSGWGSFFEPTQPRV